MKKFFSEKVIADIRFSVITDSIAIKRVLINSTLPSTKHYIKTHPSENPILNQCIQQLEEYFSLKRKTFNLPLNPDGTEFQKKVWRELMKIPYGQVISYKQLALRIGNLNSIRAVGRANGLNPIAVIIPCHRVIGKNGSLVGYSAGIEIKRKLLMIEGALPERFL